MGEIFYALKMLGITALVVMGLQVKVSHVTIEQHVYKWIKTTTRTLKLDEVAAGAALGIQKGAEQASELVSSTFKKEENIQPARR